MVKFEKVSYEEWARTIGAMINMDEAKTDEDKKEIETVKNALLANYEKITLPKRATANSAGYDIFSPFDLTLLPNVWTFVPTGIKMKVTDNEKVCLIIAPKSGLGFNYMTRLANTIGVIDADYYGNPTNEGHIFIKIANGQTFEGCPVKPVTDIRTAQKSFQLDMDAEETQARILRIDLGKAFVQGIIVPYITAEEDAVTEERNGGLGSTNA